MAISSRQPVTQLDEGTGENTHGCEFEGFFSQDISLLHSPQSHCAPSLSSQNESLITNNVKDFKNHKLRFPGAVVPSLWELLDWNELSWATAAQGWEAHRKGLASFGGSSRMIYLIEAAPWGTWNEKGWVWAQVPGSFPALRSSAQALPRSEGGEFRGQVGPSLLHVAGGFYTGRCPSVCL